MKYLIYAGNTNKYFTFKKQYPILDYLENNGFLVADDDNKEHYISGEYAVNFELLNSTK